MNGRNGDLQVNTAKDVRGYASATTATPVTGPVPLTTAEREIILKEGAEFTALNKGTWLLISGELNSTNTQPKPPEVLVRQSCLDAFGYPPDASKRCRIINVLVDSKGGSLDSAYTIVLYLSRYAKELNVYVPTRAKSASTLIALGADHIYMSKFGQLGPLDTQINNPRDPAQTVSALDCYQSVEHVRRFGFNTMTDMLSHLHEYPAGRIPLTDLLQKAAELALGTMKPMLEGVNALDFGAWGRSLQIGEKYARILLQSRGFDPVKAEEISLRLVYGYTHHLFPIDEEQARKLGLKVESMGEDAYMGAQKVVSACHDKFFVGFISDPEAKRERVAKEERRETDEAEDTKLGPQANEPEPVPMSR
jgi:Serine dehydrogenase proteinase